MIDVVLLDAGPLGMLAHPRANTTISDWFKQLVVAGCKVVVPEIADYEVRRELIRAGRLKGLRRLDRLKLTIGYLPITTAVMLQAAEFWAAARNAGTPTATDAALDADVILAAQAKIVADSGLSVIIATDNVGHLGRFVAAQPWERIAARPDSL